MTSRRPAARVKRISQADDRTLSIDWTDDTNQSFDVVELRRLCPCAMCVDEMTGQRTLEPAMVKDSVRPLQIESVGKYALSVHFSDGHKTGIYTFDFLRQLN